MKYFLKPFILCYAELHNAEQLTAVYDVRIHNFEHISNMSYGMANFTLSLSAQAPYSNTEM